MSSINGTLCSHKKNGFAICSNMDGLEDTMLSETSQTKTNTILYHLYVKCKNYNKLVNVTKKKQTYK